MLRGLVSFGHAQRLQRTLIRSYLSTEAANAPFRNCEDSVSANIFAENVRKCGLSKKRLHHQLYPMDQGQRAPKGKFPIAVAVSGGADSMALMLLLREYLHGNRIKTPLLAVTVDHQLRIGSSREALEVAKICAERGGITHVTKVCEWHLGDTEKHSGGEQQSDLLRPVKPRDSKIEEQARQYRYNLLRRVCLEYGVRCLFVAHNLGDQLETTLFRLGRASGINGLAGIANQLPFLSLEGLPDRSFHGKGLDPDYSATLLRPLLSVTKDELMATCDRFQQTWIHDPSNDDLMYDRVRIRQELKRVKREQGAEVLDLFARFQVISDKAKKEFALIERAMLRKYTVTWGPDLVVLRLAVFHDPNMFEELLYRLLSIIIVHIGTKETPPRLASVVRLVRDLQRLESGKQITLGGCRIKCILKGHQLAIQPERKI
ncbi:PP-loop family [Phytophthora infestans]|uniref:tRNA(Ile)-lysidine synthetase n=1 Tax=Phytophthora infestans TaxID=4787 RepID=A0A8S9U2T5_PHYIN|nr:PP-loop family [Phytophthora infestans]KAF4134412.1 PP-loop family [Phytophthora infestans]KAF4135265.1 PP-loop family [Phytophthora infestans]